MNPRSKSPFESARGFSLIEVVLSLAITAFTLVALLGLFVGGVKTTKESEFDINAANLASSLIAIRRDMPTNMDTTNMNVASGQFILPPMCLPEKENWPAWPSDTNITILTNGVRGTIVVDEAGFTNAGFIPYYRVTYEIRTNEGNISSLYLSFSNPPNETNQGNALNRYEIFTMIRMPYK